MDRQHNDHKKRGGIWAFIGYASFGILGIFLGAALFYFLFSAYLIPVTDEQAPEEVREEVPEADPDPEEEALPDVERDRDTVEIVDSVMPAVVGVSSLQNTEAFGEQQVQQAESASGVIVSSDGYIVTNQHVIRNGEEIMVIIPDKGHYEAELIGSDAMTDLALLRIEETGLTYVPLADSGKNRVGETVLAIGNPLGLQQTVTLGIISAVDRQVRIPGTDYAHTFVQTDAVVNPGNSGGPLLNMQGEIVGINTAKIALAGVEGIGLSIPSSTVDRVIRDLQEYGEVKRPHMGVLIDDYLSYDDPEPDKGVYLVEIVPDSPADQAGLTDGDIIVEVDNQGIDYIAQLFDKLLFYYPDDTVTIKYYRDGVEKQATLTFEERPDDLDLEPSFPEDPEDDLEEEEEGFFEEEFFD